ncbi:MAG: hypothetical protein IJF84_00240 [Thermoguttaceae bacterium]|nr:hypothetical protein [Thermoguttaceae bacterium]
MKKDKYSLEEDRIEITAPEEQPEETQEDEWDKEPEVVEEIGNLRLDPEAAKRYREILKARQKSDGRSFL